ncbi:trypsin CFT-1-like [Battus philenor]|uniref:trypsin CFT-1-like n=1 Tax=Battus philenor TaxID=42288 RepID=UPI0035D0A86E
MNKIILLLAICFAVVAAFPTTSQKIVGGSTTTIDQYPFGASLLFAWSSSIFYQGCGGTILNSRSILSAAHCFYEDIPRNWRIRVGSTWANSGGTVHNTAQIIMFSNYQARMFDDDIAILRSASNFIFSNSVRPGSIAGPNYVLADNQAVWAIGWGEITAGGSSSEQLRHVQLFVINQNICRTRYMEVGSTISDNMLCAGWLDVGGRDQCHGDSGGPLLHNDVVVGVCSWGYECGHPRYPGVNARVSRYTSWILSNA